MEPIKIIRYPALKAIIGISRIQIRRLEKAGKFPMHIQLSANVIGWIESEIYEWINERKVERNGV
jgi:prophage regulatory protein